MESQPYFDRKASIGEGSAKDRLGEKAIAAAVEVIVVRGCGGRADCGVVAVEVDVDPFSHFSASSLKLLDPTTDDGEAELSFLGGANGRSFGRSVDIFSVSGFAGISSPPDFSPLLNRETFIFVSLLMDEVEEPEMDELQSDG